MILELKGKGLICDVYYLSPQRLTSLIADASSKEVGISHLISQYCDYHNPIARGFYADNNDTTCTLTIDKGEPVTVQMCDYESWNQILDVHSEAKTYDQLQELFYDDEFLVERFTVETPEPDPGQICILAYTEFSQGTSTTYLNGEFSDELKGLRFKVKSVDCDGKFVRDATYTSDFSDQYNGAELAILGIKYCEKSIEIGSPKFNNSITKVWLYKFNKDAQCHELDYFESKKLKWLTSTKDQSSIKISTITVLRVEKPCFIEIFKKTIYGIEVYVKRAAFDAWNDVELNIPIQTDLPPSGQPFSIKDLVIDMNILKISTESTVQYTILGEVPINVKSKIDENIKTDSFAKEWEKIEEDYIIQYYTRPD